MGRVELHHGVHCVDGSMAIPCRMLGAACIQVDVVIGVLLASIWSLVLIAGVENAAGVDPTSSYFGAP